MYKSINDDHLIKKINEMVIESTFFEGLSIWIKEEWLLSNNFIAFPVQVKNVFELFKKINKKYYISGVDVKREKHRKLLPIDNYQIDHIENYFLSPDYVYEIIDDNFCLYTLEPPHYYLIVNKTFDFGFIYDNDTCGDYYVWGKEKYWIDMFGENFIKIITNKLKKVISWESINMNYPTAIRTNPKEVDYYEFILKKQGYLPKGDK